MSQKLCNSQLSVSEDEKYNFYHHVCILISMRRKVTKNSAKPKKIHLDSKFKHWRRLKDEDKANMYGAWAEIKGQ